MNRRLRKKLYLDEFTVHGFDFSCRLESKIDEELDGFFDALFNFIESRQLKIGGGGEEHCFEAYVMAGDRYSSATEDDVAALKAFLDGLEGVSDIDVKPLSNAYYD